MPTPTSSVWPSLHSGSWFTFLSNTTAHQTFSKYCQNLARYGGQRHILVPLPFPRYRQLPVNCKWMARLSSGWIIFKFFRFDLVSPSSHIWNSKETKTPLTRFFRSAWVRQRKKCASNWPYLVSQQKTLRVLDIERSHQVRLRMLIFFISKCNLLICNWNFERICC